MTTSEKDLLVEGATEYIDALSAIEAFEGRARTVCRDVYKKYKSDLVAKMGLEDSDCEDHVNRQPAERYAELGVLQNSPSGRETFYVYLRWDGTNDGVPEVSACLGLEFSKKGDLSEYDSLVRKSHSIQVAQDSSYPCLLSFKKLSDLTSCAETLGGLLDNWLAIWPTDRKLR